MVTRLQDQLFHDVLLPEDAQRIRQEVRAFVQDYVEPVAHEIAQQEEALETFPWTIFKKMAEQGLFQIPFPAEYGGRGLPHPTCATVVTMEELAYASNSIAAIFDVQCMLAGQALMYGSAEVKVNYLGPLIRGEKVASFATTEPDASSDLSLDSLMTTAHREGDTWVVTGRKRFITNAPVADFVTLLCKTGDALNMFVVDLHSPGVYVGEPDRKTGNRAQLTADIVFDNAVTPVTHQLGSFGKGLRVALTSLTFGRIGIGATGVGMAQAALDEAVEYMEKRKAFGKKLAQFQY